MEENKIQTKGDNIDAKPVPKELQPINQGRQEKPHLLFWMMLTPSILLQISFVFVYFLVGSFFTALVNSQLHVFTMIELQQWVMFIAKEILLSFLQFKFGEILIHNLAVIINWLRVFLLLLTGFFFIYDKWLSKKK